MLHEALEIIFEVERKKNNEIIREISFPIYKTCFFPFVFSLDPSYFQTS
jgi:hypothetical protein